MGTFKGKEELKRILTWDTQIMPTVKSRRSRIRIMVKGNKAVTEDISEGEYEGKKYEVPAITVFEFNDDKIQHIRLFYDKLSIIKQVTMQYKGVTGWFAKRLVNSIVKRAEKGCTSGYSAISKYDDEILLLVVTVCLAVVEHARLYCSTSMLFQSAKLINETMLFNNSGMM